MFDVGVGPAEPIVEAMLVEHRDVPAGCGWTGANSTPRTPMSLVWDVPTDHEPPLIAVELQVNSGSAHAE
ncbi:hypothetical protein [Amycolatopsis thailandensis]|uniref:hypothetical protein n=1 Tax=Amycolatopsis thailandensis TaxID=589330 RepID=UPI00363495CB